MRRLGIEGLSPYAYPGGVVSGEVVLELDQPARGRDLSIRLIGRELSQTTISTGKSTERIQDQSVFLDLTYDLASSVQFLDPNHLAAGTYRTPFQLPIPPADAPSLYTSEVPPGDGLLSGRRDGMYVEYEVEARLDVPWWVDSTVRTRLPVFSARRVLGQLPLLQSQPNPGHPSLVVRPAGPTPLLPGASASLTYDVQNPLAKRLERVLVSVERIVEYRVRSMSRVAKGPAFVAVAELNGRAPSYSGSMALSLPNTPAVTGPWQGTLFRTYWLATATLVVEFGFNVVVEGPLLPA